MSDSQLESFEIETVEVFDSLNNPTRLRILRRLQEPSSIREVAEALDVPPTRLYYHFNLLEEVGVIRVVETRKVGAMLQKVYQAVAKTFRPSPGLATDNPDPKRLAKITASVLDGARLDAEEALEKYFESVRRGENVDPIGSIGRSIAHLSPKRAQEVIQRLEKMLAEDFDSDESDEGTEYGFTYAFFPLIDS